MWPAEPDSPVRSLRFSGPASNSPRNTILTSVITASLTQLGYDPHLTQRVALLATNNTHTVECSGPRVHLNPRVQTYSSQQTLKSLMRQAESRGGINSNEPVLLINNLGGLDDGKLHEITDAAADMLRTTYDNRPVRVYAGTFTPAASDEKPADFSISILNVVNTDIGSPGMVQLLDMADWRAKGAMRREQWDGSGWNLVERDDYWTEYNDFQQEKLSEAGGSESGEWESEPELEDQGKDVDMEKDEITAAMEDTQENAKKLDAVGAVLLGPGVKQHIDSAASKGADVSKEAKLTSDLPAEDPESERPQLHDITDPSLEREHDNESPLDKVAKLSQKLPISKAGSAYATAATLEKADLPGEDEYEVL